MAARKSKNVSNADVSNKTVIAVLVVVILVSVVSLAVYMNALDSAEPELVGGDTGQVSLKIDQPSPPAEDVTASAQVGVTIEESSS